MTARETILARIRQNKPDELPLPAVPDFGNVVSGNVVTPTHVVDSNRVARFAEVLAFVGGRLVDATTSGALPFELGVWLQTAFPEAERVAIGESLRVGGPLRPERVAVAAQTDKATLEGIDVAVLAGAFAVAENAAVWLPETHMLHRALPFIAQHLVLLVPRTELLPTMHDAYARLATTSVGDYGVFIAGPSKTADIEQSLVIGAHGARSLTVILHG